jgi:hypothetical protein
MAKPNHTALTLSMSVGSRGRLAKESFVTNGPKLAATEVVKQHHLCPVVLRAVF